MSRRHGAPEPARRPAHLRQEDPPPPQRTPGARSRHFAVALAVIVVVGAGIGVGLRLALDSSPSTSPGTLHRGVTAHGPGSTGSSGTAHTSATSRTSGSRATPTVPATATTAPATTTSVAGSASGSRAPAPTSLPATTTSAPVTTTSTTLAPPTATTLAPSNVLVEVLNGSGVGGIAVATARELRAAGFLINGTGNAASFEHADNVAEYSAGSGDAAETVSSYLTGTTRLEVVDGLASNEVYLVLGSSFRGLVAY